MKFNDGDIKRLADYEAPDCEMCIKRQLPPYAGRFKVKAEGGYVYGCTIHAIEISDSAQWYTRNGILG